MPTITSPKYMKADNSIIDVLIDGQAFSAMATDPEAHGQEIYANAVAGMYGPITAYVPPLPPTVFMIKRSRLLERINTAGKFNQLKAYFNSHDFEHEVWLASDGFANNNAMLLAIIAAIGANPAVILAYPP